MKIKSKLLLIAAFSVLAIAILGTFLFFSIRAFDRAIEKNRIVNEIASRAFERRLVLDEYLLYRLERSKQQWMAISDSLNAYLHSQDAKFSRPGERTLMESLASDNEDSGMIFSRLVAAAEDAEAIKGSEAAREDRITRLTSQLLVKSQDVISKTNELAVGSLEEAVKARRNIISLLICFIAGLGLTTAVVITLLWRNVADPIIKLSEGTKIVAGGNLNYQVEVRSRDEVGELTLSFNEMTRKLEEIDRAKTEFVSLASHQLKTPLTSIGWYTEMLLSRKAGKILKKENEYLEKIARNHRRMVELVNALLNVSRLEMGTLAIQPEQLDIFAIADEVLDDLWPEIKKRKTRIEKKYAKRISAITADRQSLRIILQNLLSNSVKYTPDKGHVSLAIKKEGANLVITVSDNGYGIPELQKGEIFKKMFRADNVQKKNTDGSGLGLYIVKSLVEKLNGKIWFESKEDKGTRFFVTLPLGGG